MSAKELYDNYIMHTYGFDGLTIVKGKGCYVYDDKDNKYLDLASGIGVNSLGYGNEKQKEAIKNQIDNLLHISNLFLNPLTGEAAKKLMNITAMGKVFFSNSGAEAVEGAIKLARKYSFDKYGEGRGTILTLKQSFHGRTLAALTATGQDKFHNYFHPFPCGFNYVEPNDFDDLKEKLDSTVCALIMEPIQGEGGVNPLDKDFVKQATKLCKEKDVLVIFDEVQTGVGRTGYFLGQEYFGVKGDITTLAKGLGGGVPVGAFMCSNELSNVLNPGDHGSTYGGNPLVMSSVNVVLDSIGQEDFLTEVKDKGQFLMDEINNIGSKLISKVKGIGLMVGIDVTCNVKEVVSKLQDKGVIAITAGANTLRLLPPLVVSKEDLNFGVNVLKEVLLEMEN